MKQTIILLYGGRSAEREVSVLSAESVMRAVNYDHFTVKTFFISQSGDFIKTQEFSQTPGQEDRLMTNETIDWTRKSRQVLSTKKELWSFQFFMDRWEKTVQFKDFLKF